MKSSLKLSLFCVALGILFKGPLAQHRPWLYILKPFPKAKTALHDFKQRASFHTRNLFLRKPEENSLPIILGALHAQLGNQLFEVAATYALAKDHGAKAIFPDLLKAKHSDIPINYKHVLWKVDASNPTHKIQSYYKTSSNHYAQIPYTPNMQIEGYFQSDKYFSQYKDEIISLFAPSKEIEEYLSRRYEKILSHPNSVAVHIRTYFKEDPEGKGPLPFLGIEYFQKVMATFPEDTLFVICSDKIAYCKEQLQNTRENLVFIENEPYYMDFYLMSLCKHNIISNSSFSWWAAYLNQNPEKTVIAPPYWYRSEEEPKTQDIVPTEWYVTLKLI